MRQGEKFGPEAAAYERGRPGWPEAAADLVASGLGLGPDATVVEVGAGTGKLTRLLAARFATLHAVEPLPEMRALAKALAPGVEVYDGSAERLPLPDGSADAVVVAEAFHWFDGAAALAEAARVLRPGGGVALLWNLPDGPQRPPLPEAARDLVRAAIARGGEPGGALLRRGEWRAAFDACPFGPLHHGEAHHQVIRDRDQLIDFYTSMSSIAGQPAAARAALRAQLRELLPETGYRQPLRTEVYWARLLPARWCGRCGAEAPDRPHDGCAGALEPPRYCRYCRRRMKVQVVPAGWWATCAVHGTARSG